MHTDHHRTFTNRFIAVTLFAAACCPVATLAQDSSHISKVTRLGILLPSFSYELPAGKNNSIQARVYMNANFTPDLDFASSENSSRATIDPGLAFSGAFRHYYNYSNRLAKGKRTERNSLNFVSVLVGTSYTRRPVSFDYGRSRSLRFVHQAAMLWGLQRNYAGRFSFELNTGAGVYMGESNEGGSAPIRSYRVTAFRPVIQFSMGLWLNRKG